MEPHQGKPKNFSIAVDPLKVDLEELFEVATIYAEEYHRSTLDGFRFIKIENLTPDTFWREYIWAVYTSGFKASIITKKFPDLMEAYGYFDSPIPLDCTWVKVRPIFANKRKHDAISRCRGLIWTLRWDQFNREYCQSPATLKMLPFIGDITCYHLARNLGMDAVKPDLHLIRLSNYYGFNDPETMCYYLSGLSGERIGVVDFILWAYSAAFGTKDLEFNTQRKEAM